MRLAEPFSRLNYLSTWEPGNPLLQPISTLILKNSPTVWFHIALMPNHLLRQLKIP